MWELLTSSGVEHAAEVQWTAGRKTANWKKAVQERMFGVRDGSNRPMDATTILVAGIHTGLNFGGESQLSRVGMSQKYTVVSWWGGCK